MSELCFQILIGFSWTRFSCLQAHVISAVCSDVVIYKVGKCVFLCFFLRGNSLSDWLLPLQTPKVALNFFMTVLQLFFKQS